MSKEEIALELTKLTYASAAHVNKISGTNKKPQEVVTELYNYIFNNLADSKPDKP